METIDKTRTCQGCPDRSVGCHATCEGYQERYRRQRCRAERDEAQYMTWDGAVRVKKSAKNEPLVKRSKG